MIWEVYADDTLIYAPELETLALANPVLEMELNTSGSFSFTMYPTHPNYGQIEKMSTIIKVKKLGDTLFIGRVLSVNKGYYNQLTYYCEGCLGYFNDSIIRPYDFLSGDLSTTPRELLSYFITQHNSQVTSNHQFTLGNCSINDSIVRSNTEYQSTWENISDRLLDSYGGYIVPRYDGNTIYLDYSMDFDTYSNEVIKYGSNLKDLKLTNDGTELCSVLIPLGVQDEETGERLTIASANNGLDYIEDADAIASFGRITKVVKWDDVTIADNLLTKARAYLNNAKLSSITLDVSAIDLSNVTRSMPYFKLGTYVTVEAPEHDIATDLLISKISYNLASPKDDKLTLSKTVKGATKLLNSSTNAIIVQQTDINNNIVNTNTELASYKIISDDRYSEITQAEGEIRQSVTDSLTEAKAYTDGRELVITNTLSSSIYQTASGLNLTISNVEAKADANTSAINKYEEYFDFTENGLEISKNNSNTKTRYGSNGMEILTDDEVVAMAKSDGFGMTSAIISENVNSTTAWKIVPRGTHLTISRKV